MNTNQALKELSDNPSFLKRIVRTIYNVIEGFIHDDCYGKASALAFYTILSIVPVLAVVFGIAKGFGFEKAIEKEITSAFGDQPQLAEKAIQFAHSWLLNVQGGVIAGIGTILLLWTVLGLLSNIESALNSIWKTDASRPYAQKISNYLATIIIAPLFIVASSSITIFLSTQIAASAKNYTIIEALSPFLLATLKLSPYFLSWLFFTFIYIFLPHTKVYWKTAIIAAIIAGTSFQLWQWFYITFQIGVSSYGAIYGSFAAVPLFLIWLQISWLIFLVGAELAFHLENDLFIPNQPLKSVSEKALALIITHKSLEVFSKGLPPITNRQLSLELCLPLNVVDDFLRVLTKASILSELCLLPSGSVAYQPAKSQEFITMKSVCDAIENSHNKLAYIPHSKKLEFIQKYLDDIKDNEKKIKTSNWTE